MIYDPFEAFRAEVHNFIRNSLESLYPEVSSKVVISLEDPPPGHGDLAFRCFEVARHLGVSPEKVSKAISSRAKEFTFRYVSKVVSESGYVNFYMNLDEVVSLMCSALNDLGEKFGFNPAPHTHTVLVEFLSANPIHPIHIGGARNAILGDSLSRLLTWRGHKVLRHFYVDDVGRQVAIAAFGFNLLGRPSPWTKPDHAIGYIYALTSSLIEVYRLKESLKRARALGKDDYYRAKVSKLDEWMRVIIELKERNPSLFEVFIDKFEKVKDPEAEIRALMKRYEAKDPEAVDLIRGMCNLVLSGFKQTLDRAGIYFDSFDWESEITVWSGLVIDVIRKLEATPYVTYSDGALVFMANRLVRDFDLADELKIPKNYEVPSLTLIRSDGTTLYTTRDIAYTLWKFKRADKVINVIGVEQKITQLQLKLALIALGYKSLAENLVHFGYELVNMPGYKMSSRRGRYITFDELMEEAVKKAKAEVDTRSPHLPIEVRRSIAEKVGIGAIKYAFLSVSSLKPVTFRWSKVLNFERNSAPFIQYAHARAFNILTKAGVRSIPHEINPSLLRTDTERDLLVRLIRFPRIIAEAADKLRPDLVAEYANDIAISFNSFYDKVPVIRSESEDLRNARLWLVNVTRIVLRNSLNILGIAAPQRM